jgi:ring-1,2-phenylacetyl-CoA epoxidase subunit PaaB
MSDTQWPRYQVFVQEKDGGPYLDAGSVHAPDVEMALQNARDVFVRRPACASLWVVPAGAIYSRTAEELQAAASTGTQTLQGPVEAAGPAAALKKAVEMFSGENRPPFAWWVLPARAITQTLPEEADSLFAPAFDKPFRLATDFRTVSAMRQIRQASPGAGLQVGGGDDGS